MEEAILSIDLVTDPGSWFVEFLVLLMLLDLFDLTFRVCGGDGAGQEVTDDVDDGGQGVNQRVKLEDREFIEVANATSIFSSLLASVLASALPSANASILAEALATSVASALSVASKPSVDSKSSLASKPLVTSF
jgi:hypothetical protein